MAISDEDVARVRAATDVVQVVSEVLALKRVGRRYTGLCPFHSERSPSFSVNAELGLYYCFGCQAKGDVITFVRETQHLDFPEAVEYLAAKAGIHIEHSDTAASRDRERRSRLTEVLERAVEWYHERLLTGADAGAARGYLRSRGIDGDIARQFRVGWAPDDWDSLARFLKVPDAVLRDSGLGFLNSRGRQQDFFRARVLFPIFEPGGKPVAFGGRVLPGAEGSKYKNSSESPVYAKSRTLYALNWAKRDVVDRGEVIVCEGYTDVIGFFQAGVPRAVATCGTALGEDHFRLMKSFARRVVLAYDADKAGQAAADRFYEWEKRYDVEVAVAALPKGADPADVARRDPAALAAAVERAQPFLGFRIDRVLGAADLRTPEGRARAAEAALEMVVEHPSDLVRDQYLGRIAAATGIEIEQLRRSLGRAGLRAANRTGAGVRTVRPIEVRAPSRGTVPRSEELALRVAVHDPAQVEAQLGVMLPDLSPEIIDRLFTDDRIRAAIEAMVRSSTVAEAVAVAEPEASDLLQRVAVQDWDPEADWAVPLCWSAARRIQAELVRSVQEDPERNAELAPTVAWLASVHTEMQRADATPTGRLDSARGLVAWLAGQAEEET